MLSLALAKAGLAPRAVLIDACGVCHRPTAAGDVRSRLRRRLRQRSNADDWPAGYQKIGNFIWLEHEDDTFAVYFHNKKDTANVALGQTPRRAAQLAQTGNTGQSTGPHVRFGLFTMQGGNVIPGTRACLEAFTGTEKTYDGCYIPRNGQPFFSTNGPLLGD